MLKKGKAIGLGVATLFGMSFLIGCGENAHTHTWYEPTYSWTEDHSKCTAKRVCQYDPNHIESETVDSTYVVVDPATCSKTGLGRYTATFTNTAFVSQNYEITIKESEHHWDEGEITRFPTIYEEGVKTYTCVDCQATKEESISKVTDATDYVLKATKMEGLTGVYTAKAVVGANKDTLGIPEIAKQNLVSYPAYSGPGIIQGAAIEYEVRKGPTTYEPIPGKELVAPYSYFRYSITEVEMKDADGNITKHLKPSGFDGTYYIIRLDVSDIVNNQTGYLHVQQTDNKALMVLLGMQNGIDTHVKATDSAGKATTRPTIENGFWSFGSMATDIKAETNHNNSLAYAGSNGNWYVGGTGFGDGMGKAVATYSLENNAAALKDKNGIYQDTPYIDICVLSSGKLAAGADAGKETAPKSDISLSFYIDETLDYNPSLVYDPTSQDVNHVTNVMKKFYDDTKTSGVTSYLVKGSDLEIDVSTIESKQSQDVEEFWSLTKAMDFQDYNAHTIKLLCEVPVLEGLLVESKTEEKREVILDVNSFDIQIANHSETNAAALTVRNNASLEILDNSNTVGAELAIGNNAQMEVQDGGTLIIDKTCQLEVEYDAASVVHDATHYTVEQVEQKINELDNLITIPVSEDDRANITAVQDAFNNLTSEEQALVSNKQKLDDYVAALPAETPLTNGMVMVRSGGRLVNEGIINVEGLEVKPAATNPQEASQVVDRDMKAAALLVEDGGVIDNYGCMGIKGELYLLGTLNNYGKYKDIIKGTDPDKGTVDHHKGIQVTWKDDVTVLKEGSTTEYTVNPDVKPGKILVGKDGGDLINKNAKLNNYGDVVLVPGTIEVYGTFENVKTDEENKGGLYLCEVSEAVVPITPDPNDPTKLEERRTFTPPYQSVFTYSSGTFVNNGVYANTTIHVISNGILGDMGEIIPII